MKSNLVLSCGEISGDLGLATLLGSYAPSLRQVGVGGVMGPELTQLGFTPWRGLDGLQIMGFSDVLRSLPRLYQHEKWLIKTILYHNPCVIICADYPGLHLRLAKALRKGGYKGRLIQYICPSIWAWKKERLHDLDQYFDEVWGILPFEKNYFVGKKVRYRYVGNPSMAQAQKDRATFQHRNEAIGLFPGSRRSEIHVHLPLILKVVQEIDSKTGPQIWKLALADESLREIIQYQLQHYPKLNIEWILPQKRLEEMSSLKAAIAVSGTVCLELALHQVPTLAVYEAGWVNYLVAKYLCGLNLHSYTLPNLLKGKPVFPEVIAPKLCSHDIAHAFLPWLEKKEQYQQIERELDLLWQSMLQSELASERISALDQLEKWLKEPRL